MMRRIGHLDWYAGSRAMIERTAGPNRASQWLLASELALWSQDTTAKVASNLALTAHNAFAAGTPERRVGTRRQARLYNRARARGHAPPLPKKLRVFAGALYGEATSSAATPAWVESLVESEWFGEGE